MNSHYFVIVLLLAVFLLHAVLATSCQATLDQQTGCPNGYATLCVEDGMVSVSSILAEATALKATSTDLSKQLIEL